MRSPPCWATWSVAWPSSGADLYSTHYKPRPSARRPDHGAQPRLAPRRFTVMIAIVPDAPRARRCACSAGPALHTGCMAQPGFSRCDAARASPMLQPPRAWPWHWPMASAAARSARRPARPAVRGFLEDYYGTTDAWSVRRAAQRVLSAINSWLHAQTQRSDARFDKDRGYVCTFSALVVKAATAHLLHVGDARIYRLHGAACGTTHRRPPRARLVEWTTWRGRWALDPHTRDRLPAAWKPRRARTCSLPTGRTRPTTPHHGASVSASSPRRSGRSPHEVLPMASPRRVAARTTSRCNWCASTAALARSRWRA